MHITNGSVSRTLRTGDFENRVVNLSFTVEEGDDAEAATAKVVAMVERLVTQKAPVKEPKPPVVIGVKEPTAAVNPPVSALVSSPSAATSVASEPAPSVDEKPITDQNLTDCINAALGRGVAGPDIRRAIDKVSGVVGSSVYMLADRAKRQEVLDVIGNMSKAAAEPADVIRY